MVLQNGVGNVGEKQYFIATFYQEEYQNQPHFRHFF